jgi:transposase
VSWRPVCHRLDAHPAVVRVTPPHLRAVPGRTTAVDGTAAEWRADLLAPGLLQPRCIPPAPVRALRALVRFRTARVPARTPELTRVHKRLKRLKRLKRRALGHMKLAAGATEGLGKRGRALLQGLGAGDPDPQALAARARGRWRGGAGEPSCPRGAWRWRGTCSRITASWCARCWRARCWHP